MGAARRIDVRIPKQGGQEAPDRMPPSQLRDALQVIHFGLLFNEEHGMEVGSVFRSIREDLDVSPRRALGEALRMGLVRRERDDMWRDVIPRGPRSAGALRRVYDGEPPTGGSVTAEARAWDEHLEAGGARLRALRGAARPGERDTPASLPAWMPWAAGAAGGGPGAPPLPPARARRRA